MGCTKSREKPHLFKPPKISNSYSPHFSKLLYCSNPGGNTNVIASLHAPELGVCLINVWSLINDILVITNTWKAPASHTLTEHITDITFMLIKEDYAERATDVYRRLLLASCSKSLIRENGEVASLNVIKVWDIETMREINEIGAVNSREALVGLKCKENKICVLTTCGNIYIWSCMLNGGDCDSAFAMPIFNRISLFCCGEVQCDIFDFDIIKINHEKNRACFKSPISSSLYEDFIIGICWSDENDSVKSRMLFVKMNSQKKIDINMENMTVTDFIIDNEFLYAVNLFKNGRVLVKMHIERIEILQQFYIEPAIMGGLNFVELYNEKACDEKKKIPISYIKMIQINKQKLIAVLSTKGEIELFNNDFCEISSVDLHAEIETADVDSTVFYIARKDGKVICLSF
ncbi:unnamed protein product [Blepharisma stoltei]|uniref:Uncharacterized protein n=1 Tax=Blepharisma stoltei TaxID=1481888 RepID=A0AAU9IP36_9CILI|nr:unnamed protein product [Blepharisma stoltei]